MSGDISGRQFAKECKARGFVKINAGYYRCIGDGVYQVIDGRESMFIDPISPYYSNIHRRSKVLFLGTWSIYADLPEYWFNTAVPKGDYFPEYLVGRSDSPFLGIQEHYKIMLEKGFDFLDHVNSQKCIVETMDKISSFRPDMNQTREICLPLLICGDKERALSIVNAELSDIAQHPLADNDPQAEKVHRILKELNDIKEAASSEEKLRVLMEKNYQRNMSYADKYCIPIREKFDVMI